MDLNLRPDILGHSAGAVTPTTRVRPPATSRNMESITVGEFTPIAPIRPHMAGTSMDSVAIGGLGSAPPGTGFSAFSFPYCFPPMGAGGQIPGFPWNRPPLFTGTPPEQPVFGTPQPRPERPVAPGSNEPPPLGEPTREGQNSGTAAHLGQTAGPRTMAPRAPIGVPPTGQAMPTGPNMPTGQTQKTPYVVPPFCPSTPFGTPYPYPYIGPMNLANYPAPGPYYIPGSIPHWDGGALPFGVGPMPPYTWAHHVPPQNNNSAHGSYDPNYIPAPANAQDAEANNRARGEHESEANSGASAGTRRKSKGTKEPEGSQAESSLKEGCEKLTTQSEVMALIERKLGEEGEARKKAKRALVD